ncbi:DNA-binding response regulator [Bremerella cremea]|uniref:DNA-binding response regulator n=1 Tax=Bremerella cremea TaxID=1031537 RepID=A0A368KVY1_9BACT|nr:response regulator transcription factor [Bremerella cremea]RCS53042.1 DNA-binding response regulator [Bremerella cremea]
MSQRSILIVESPRGPLQTVAHNLQQTGCRVFVAQGMRDGLQKVLEYLPDVVVLSQNLPADDLLELCRSIMRNVSDETAPAILIAPTGADLSSIEDPSHDSRLAESLALDLLAQCVKTLTFRARQTNDTQSVLECHGLRLDPRFAVVEMDGKRLDLTPTEFRLLQALLSRPGHVLTRVELENAAVPPAKGRESEMPGENSSRTRRIDVHIKSIRSKLRQKSVLIETVRSVGYRFREPAWNITSSH